MPEWDTYVYVLNTCECLAGTMHLITSKSLSVLITLPPSHFYRSERRVDMILVFIEVNDDVGKKSRKLPFLFNGKHPKIIPISSNGFALEMDQIHRLYLKTNKMNCKVSFIVPKMNYLPSPSLTTRETWLVMPLSQHC